MLHYNSPTFSDTFSLPLKEDDLSRPLELVVNDPSDPSYPCKIIASGERLTFYYPVDEDETDDEEDSGRRSSYNYVDPEPCITLLTLSLTFDMENWLYVLFWMI